MRRKESGLFYYLFWSIVVFLGSLVGILIINRINPESLLAILRGNRLTFDTNSVIEDPRTQRLQEQQDSANTSSKNNTSTGTLKRRDRARLDAPLFDGTITQGGTFTNFRGTVFSAGTLRYTGRFPTDFEITSTDAETTVHITLALGWEKLPNFSAIDRLDKSSNVLRVTLPPLSILDLKIDVIEVSDSKQKQAIKEQISTYVQTLFRRQLIPEKILILAQQRLAAAYIAHSYADIEFTPY